MTSTDRKNSCYGWDCCHTSIPSYTNAFEIFIIDDDFRNNNNDDDTKGKDGCKYAFNADRNWLHDNSTEVFLPGVLNRTHVPVVLNWDLLRNSYHVQSLEDMLTSSPSNSSVVCNITSSISTRHETRLFCSCREGYEGNDPYLPRGCQGKVVA
ncbi:hypothetical protein TIFTF001_024467 [Ficus carica]|uniref:Wall-associated receptor kinase domain-containing protein n=1 Tax=Ficus carica TaxID=3494 RepID=A0AA88AVQ8_FICCA|nr:hypothetical protein TIFTF001_024467 [Ficus carica]